VAESKTEGARDGRRKQGGGTLSTLLGGALLVLVGFAAGLVVGASFEDPDLVANALAGNATDVRLPEAAPTGSVAPPPAALPQASAPLGTRPADTSAPVIAAPPVAASVRPVAPPPAARAPAPGSAFSVQVGAFQEERPARGLVKQLEGRGFAAFVLSEGRSGPWRVRVGPVATREEADGLARKLKRDQGLPTWVVTDG
jgi:cell division septation protein DedD